MAEPQILDRYRRWIETRPSDTRGGRQAEVLVRTGNDGGSATLYARDKAGEFVLECEHKQFRAVLVIGCETHVQGIYLASFKGDEAVAGAFALGLARLVGGNAGDPGDGSTATVSRTFTPPFPNLESS